jgi:TRAP-type C4-dicarboxylate transport system permease small subunit
MTAYQLAIVSAGLFFLNALLTGVWKYLEIRASDDARAHPYVDIAHRTSLLYSFAALLIASFVEISQLPARVEFVATAFLVAYFALAIGSYMVQGARKATDNQLRDASPAVGWFMWTLIVAEIGGFCVLFYGVVVALFGGGAPIGEL